MTRYQDPTDNQSRRRRMLPWAIGVAVVVISAAAAFAFLEGDSADDPVAASDGPSSNAPTTSTEATAPAEGSLAAGFATDEPAPDFDVDAFDGSTFRLSDHLAVDGRPIMLNLWASWCFPCREEMPAIDSLAANHPEILFLGVAVEDDPVEAEKFGAEIGVSYLLAIDESGEVSSKYPALGLPATFLISPEGRMIAKLFGGASEETFEQFLTFLDS